MSRRRFLGALGALGAAVAAPELVSTRVAFAAPGSAGNTLISIVLRGGADGLRILAPNSADLGLPLLQSLRPDLVPAQSQLLSLTGAPGWGLHRALDPLHALLWDSGELAFVPAVAAPGASRSHFQAQQLVERGGSESYTTGWLDRVLEQVGPGQPFQALAVTRQAAPSLDGSRPKLAISSLNSFAYSSWASTKDLSQAALRAMYGDVDGTLALDVPATLDAVNVADQIRAQGGPRNGAAYPGGGVSAALRDIADVLHAEAGLAVATLDMGGWDHHAEETAQLDAMLANLATALAAFFVDLGPQRRSRVTVIVHSEFGRRVASNDSAGCDHGTGGLALVAGGGLAGSGVLGRWQPLRSEQDLHDGDVPLLNNLFDVFAEIVHHRLNVAALAQVFPHHAYRPIGLTNS